MWIETVSPDVGGLSALRRRAMAHLADEDVTGDLDLIAVLLSELIANAARHAADPRTLTLVVGDHVVRVEVRDGTPDLPRVLPVDPTRVGGNGMRLVDGLASRWGAEADGQGKVVWFEVPISRGGAG